MIISPPTHNQRTCFLVAQTSNVGGDSSFYFLLRSKGSAKIATSREFYFSTNVFSPYIYPQIAYLVIDEADRQLMDGFEESLNQFLLLSKLPAVGERVTIMTSATMSAEAKF